VASATYFSVNQAILIQQGSYTSWEFIAPPFLHRIQKQNSRVPVTLTVPVTAPTFSKVKVTREPDPTLSVVIRPTVRKKSPKVPKPYEGKTLADMFIETATPA
jgi:hypothetical protein